MTLLDKLDRGHSMNFIKDLGNIQPFWKGFAVISSFILALAACVPDFPQEQSPASQVAQEFQPNHLIGDWKLTHLVSSRQKNADGSDYRRILGGLIDKGFQVRLKITTGNEGFFEIKDSLCTVKMEFKVSYCCPGMHRMQMSETKPALSWVEDPPSCWDTAKWNLDTIWNSELDSDYHFSYDLTPAFRGQVILQGPYTKPPSFESTLFTTHIRLQRED